MKTILITGSQGQDGVLMTSHYAARPTHSVLHLVRRPRTENLSEQGPNELNLDIRDQAGVFQAIEQSQPDIIYHFAAVSSVAKSWNSPRETFEVNTLGTLNVLEAVRHASPHSRVILAGSSEIFSRGLYSANESSQISPSSPYGVSKSTNLELGRIYRDVHGLAVSTAIMFNHESHLRPLEYVSKEIAVQAARVKLGLQPSIVLRDLESSKDWGWAPEFVEGLSLLAHSSVSADLVFATGERTSVRTLAESALEGLQLDPQLVSQAVKSEARPNDNAHPVGDSTLADELLGWKPVVLPRVFMARMAQDAFSQASKELAGH